MTFVSKTEQNFTPSFTISQSVKHPGSHLVNLSVVGRKTALYQKSMQFQTPQVTGIELLRGQNFAIECQDKLGRFFRLDKSKSPTDLLGETDRDTFLSVREGMQSIYENEEQRRYMERELEIFRRSNKKGLAEQH